MEEDQILKAKELANIAIEKLNNKDFTVYFFTIDTKGNPNGGVANIYEHVKVLTDLGYKASILHEKNDYQGVESWLGSTYSSLPHKSIENQDLNITAADFLIIPEIFSNVMQQTAKFPCKRIVFCQSYDYILEMLNMGMSWAYYGITDVITTNEKVSNYVKSLFPNVRTFEVPVSIPKYFKDNGKPKKPIIGIHTRNQKDTLKIVKTFYLQNPIYKWITFKDLRGINKEAFAESLGECCLTVWIDDISSFGTLPLESMRCNVPVLGVIPNIIPEWMEDKKDDVLELKTNGVWTSNILSVPNLIADYVKVWLEDDVPQEIYESMSVTNKLYTEEEQVEKIKEIYGRFFENRKAEIDGRLETIINQIDKK